MIPILSAEKSSLIIDKVKNYLILCKFRTLISAIRANTVDPEGKAIEWESHT